MFNRRIAIIIPTFNRVKETRNIIRQLLNQDFKGYKIIICDSGSVDGTQNLVSEFPDIAILNVGVDKWWTGATNEGIRYAQKNEFSSILLLNDDLTIPENLLSVLIQNNKLYPDTLLTTAQCDINGQLYFGSHFNGLFKTRVNSKTSNNINIIDCSNGCCIMIPLTILNTIGLTNEILVPHVGGDISIFIRAKKFGFKCLMIPEIMIYHTSSTDYVKKVSINNILTNPGSALHLNTYLTIGHELYGNWFRFVFYGVKNHFQYLKEVIKTIKTLLFAKFNYSPMII